MREQRLFDGPRTAAGQPPFANPAAIQIAWDEGVAENIKIRHCHIKAATLTPFIFLKAGFLPGRGGRHRFEALAQMIVLPKPERQAA